MFAMGYPLKNGLGSLVFGFWSLSKPSRLVDLIQRSKTKVQRPRTRNFLALSFVKRCLHNFRAYQPAANIYLNLLALVRKLDWNVCHPDILFQVGGRASRSNFTDRRAIDYHCLSVARNPSFCHFKSHQPAFHSFFFLFRKFVAADEVAFVELGDPAEIGFEERSGFVDLMAIKRHARLQPESIASCQTAGQDSCV